MAKANQYKDKPAIESFQQLEKSLHDDSASTPTPQGDILVLLYALWKRLEELERKMEHLIR